jgi:hypothetical protein
MVNLKRIALCSAEKQQIPSHGEFKENSSVLSREVTIPSHGEFKENSSMLSREATNTISW